MATKEQESKQPRFLRKNGYYLEIEPDEGVTFALALANNELDMKEITSWITNHSRKV